MKRLIAGLTAQLLILAAFMTPALAEAPVAEAGDGAAPVAVTDILACFHDARYQAGYEAIVSGGAVATGSRGEGVMGAQLLLIALGQGIEADGSYGPKTQAALNAVQAAYGLTATDGVDAAMYVELLKAALFSVDEAAAQALLRDDPAYDYMLGCALEQKGLYFSAQQAFDRAGIRDSVARSAMCVQNWPESGVVWRNDTAKGYDTQLAFTYTGDGALAVRVYSHEGSPVATLFVRDQESAQVTLPAGDYYVADGTGRVWYGALECFGPDGIYEIMTLSEGGALTLEKGKRVTLHVGDAGLNEAEDIGAYTVSWEGF